MSYYFLLVSVFLQPNTFTMSDNLLILIKPRMTLIFKNKQEFSIQVTVPSLFCDMLVCCRYHYQYKCQIA